MPQIKRLGRHNLQIVLNSAGYANMAEAIAGVRQIPGHRRNMSEAKVKQWLKDEYNAEVRREEERERERHEQEERERREREERERDRYMHTIRFHAYNTFGNGTPRNPYHLEWNGEHTFTFVSRERHTLPRPFTVVEASAEHRWWTYRARHNRPPLPMVIVGHTEFLTQDDLGNLFYSPRVIQDLFHMNVFRGSDGRVAEIMSMSSQKIPYNIHRIEEEDLYKAKVKSATKAFRGFEDSGDMRCVPEVLCHHFSRMRNKNKPTIDDIIAILDETKPPLPTNITYVDGYVPKSGTRGYTSLDIVRVMDRFRCPYKLLDIEEKVFLQDTKTETLNSNIPVFVGQVFDNHLYYCSDADYIRSLASKNTTKTNNKLFTIKKKKKEFDGTVLPVDNLTQMFIESFREDRTLRKVGLYNDKIVKIEYDDKTVYANKDVEIIKEILQNLNLPFENQNMICLGKHIFDTLYPHHRRSVFNQSVFDALKANTGIVRVFGQTTGTKQYSIDINKCRSKCFRDNALGEYPVFDISCDIQDYVITPKLKLGMYYVLTDNTFPMAGNGWYSNQFLDWCKSEGFKYEIKYQILANNSLPDDYGKSIVNRMVEVSPNNYKTLVNTTIGYFGKTINKYSTGHLEVNFKHACSKFWGTDNIGSMYDLPDQLANDTRQISTTNRKRMRTASEDVIKMVDIGQFEIDDTPIYKVQETVATREYVNDLPIYQKILENEWMLVWELRKKMGGRLIKVKTDNVVVEEADECPIHEVELSDDIGGYKLEPKTIETHEIQIKVPENEVKTFETKLIWKEIKVEIGDADNFFEKLLPKLPTGSFCLTGLAGFGKSEVIKHMDDYVLDSTLKTSFTNKACESMSAQTICKAFGIDFASGEGSSSKISKCKDVKKIINDECFMTPSYCMAIFDQIKKQYPDIAFIGVGDPEQTRPVGEENVNWLNTSVFHHLCNGTIVRLIENQRNDLTPEYYQLINGDKSFDTSKFGTHTHSTINICRTNKRRVELNAQYMNTKGYYIPYDIHQHHPKGQNVYLTVGTPVMSVTTQFERGFVNSKIFTITSVKKDKIVIDGIDEPLTDKDFMMNFVVAYAFTNHKVQSITIKEPFCIHEWSRMSPREQYTAFSRTSKREYVKIYN